jgi:ribosomal protein S18 acetylase RimI-like enzyme
MTSPVGATFGMKFDLEKTRREEGDSWLFRRNLPYFFDSMQSDTLNSLHIHRFCESDRLEQYLPSAVQLIYEAAFSYFDLLFGGRKEALAELSHWAKRPSSEYSILRATGVLHKEICLGIVIGIGGKERNDCHKADILALLNSTPFRRWSLSTPSFESLRDSLPPVPADVYYIRTIGVAQDWRCRGLGKRLLQTAIENGDGAGYNRFRLDLRRKQYCCPSSLHSVRIRTNW